MSSNQVYLLVCVPVEGTVTDEERGALLDNVKQLLSDAKESGYLASGLRKYPAQDFLNRMSTPTVQIQPYETVTVYTSDPKQRRQTKVIFRPSATGFYEFEVIINNDSWGTRNTQIPNGRSYEIVHQRATHVRLEIESVKQHTEIFTTLERLSKNLMS